MAKDPAFLFYTNDFISGTQFFTDEEVGVYIRLLCAQHQHGRLSEKQVLFICKSLEHEAIKKFTKDEDNLYYNERLEIEIDRRKAFSDSRSNNRKGKGNKVVKTKNKPNNTRKTYDNHMETENETKTKDINKSELEKTFDSFLEMRKEKKKPATEKAIELIRGKLETMSNGDEKIKIEILNQSILNSWQDVFPLKTNYQSNIKQTESQDIKPPRI
jgi:uncharacterized protein YdaU (DUF1376 family)